jgi:hypothetical protein
MPDTILDAIVTAPVVYQAVYGGAGEGVSDYSLAVIFDAGDYGTITGTEEETSTTMMVEQGTVLGEVPGFAVPAITINDGNPDIAFIGWSPTVDLTTEVNSVLIYKAQYAYVPGGSSASNIFHTVSFDIGTNGTYNDLPASTSFVVHDGVSLADTPIFDISDFEATNISGVDGDFTFLGWSPALDENAPVYSDRVYTAQFSYVPQGLSNIEYTPLDVDVNPPTEHTVQALGWDGYYDGNPHGITYRVSEDSDLGEIMPFWRFDPSEKLREGLPPDETHVISEDIDLVFTADGKTPNEFERKIIIKPRPIVPKATHVTIMVGDDIPQRASYGFTIDYDGKLKNGSSIPADNPFDFAAHKGEFPLGTPEISTSYMPGDPAGDYPIYVKAGLYGDYEIYEGSDGVWPAIKGWRLAGVMHVDAKAVDPPPVVPDNPPSPSDGGITPVDDNNVDDDPDADDDGDDDDDDGDNAPGAEGGAAETGDNAHPILWMTLLLLSFVAFAVLLSYTRRRRLQ